jgi:hypothetical protein
MAKIFSTEKLALNGDQVRIESSEAGAFEITDGSNVLISRAGIESDVSSLNLQDSTNKTAVETDITSLSTLHAGDDANLDADVLSLHNQDNTNKTAVETDITSLSTLHAGDVAALDADVSSLNLQDSTNKAAVESDIASLSTLVSTNDIYAVQEDVSENSISVTIDYSSVGFASVPAVVGSLTSYVADDPIIGVQLSGDPSTSSAVFMFSDEIPSTGYKIDVLASV